MEGRWNVEKTREHGKNSTSSANHACLWKSLENRKVFRFLRFDRVNNVAGMIHSRRSMFLLRMRKKEKERRMNIGFTRLQIFSFLNSRL